MSAEVQQTPPRTTTFCTASKSSIVPGRITFNLSYKTSRGNFLSQSILQPVIQDKQGELFIPIHPSTCHTRQAGGTFYPNPSFNLSYKTSRGNFLSQSILQPVIQDKQGELFIPIHPSTCHTRQAGGTFYPNPSFNLSYKTSRGNVLSKSKLHTVIQDKQGELFIPIHPSTCHTRQAGGTFYPNPSFNLSYKTSRGNFLSQSILQPVIQDKQGERFIQIQPSHCYTRQAGGTFFLSKSNLQTVIQGKQGAFLKTLSSQIHCLVGIE